MGRDERALGRREVPRVEVAVALTGEPSPVRRGQASPGITSFPRPKLTERKRGQLEFQAAETLAA